MINISFMCEEICVVALDYYKNHKEKFVFDFNAITLDELVKPSDKNAKSDSLSEMIDSYAEHVMKTKTLTSKNGKETASSEDKPSNSPKKKKVKKKLSKREDVY